MEIRSEYANDTSAVRALLNKSFGRTSEAALVDRLRIDEVRMISRVAQMGNSLVGYILFTPVNITDRSTLTCMGLAPLAVAPEHQRQGIGSAMVQAGLVECREQGVEVVVVLGHPQFYTRFGFQAAIPLGIYCQYEVPDDLFLVNELKSGALVGVSGICQYHDAFNAAI